MVEKEARCKVESKATRLEVNRTSFLLDLGTVKDEVSSLQSQVGKDKEAMEEEYHKALEVIFAYGYGCYIFKHDICGDRPKIPEGMPGSTNPLPPEFFMSPRCPSCLGSFRGHYDRSSSERGGQGACGDCCYQGPW